MLYHNKITTIEGLSRCTKLVNLDLGGNLIEKIQGLTKLTSLRQLYLASNQIEKIEGLEGQAQSGEYSPFAFTQCISGRF